MSKPRIAVVNNDTVFLQLMHDLLSDEGYDTVIEKESGKVHAMVRDEKPHLVILDIRMDSPETGMQILELLRLDPATNHIPIIICSADSRLLREKEAILRDKGCDILEKPFDLEDLLTKVRAVLGRVWAE